MNALHVAGRIFGVAEPFVVYFAAALVAALVLVPLCRRLSILLGMVDKPGPRRINKTPIPRGGGLAIVLALFFASWFFRLVYGVLPFPPADVETAVRLGALGFALAAVGFADDKFGLPPLVKLAGQLGVAAGAFFWAGIGFHVVFPAIPVWLDFPLTLFWIAGAVNAFNLIDGLDGLATGLAAIAAVGMAGTLVFAQLPACALVYVGFAGACLGFLRYNFNPASVFLGDTGSMFLGFVLATLPLAMRAPRSITVAVIVPLCAMGVPVFDVVLAIVRRSVRAWLKREENGKDEGQTHVMRADVDHLHHRILRNVGSQRKAASLLYAGATGLVAVGIGASLMADRAAGLFIVAFVVGAVIVVRDALRVELWDAGRLVSVMSEKRTLSSFRLHNRLAVPVLVCLDVAVLALGWLGTALVADVPVTAEFARRGLPLFVALPFFMLVALHAYRTAWSRAHFLDHFKVIVAVFAGTLFAAAASIFLGFHFQRLISFCCIFAANVSLALVFLRMLHGFARDAFYWLDSIRLQDDPSVARVLVYGAGIRYRAFRRELVRSAGLSRRVIVGLLDDDRLLLRRFIGGIRVYGTIVDLQEVAAQTGATELVIACKIDPARIAGIVRAAQRCGLSAYHWSCDEKPLSAAGENASK